MGLMEGERDAGRVVRLAGGKWRGMLESTVTRCGEDGERRALEGTATWCGEDGERVCSVSVDSAGKMVVSVGDRLIPLTRQQRIPQTLSTWATSDPQTVAV